MIQVNDFVKINYTGTSDGVVFDTTVADVAKQAHLEGGKAFRPMVVCVGQGMLVAGLDAALIDKPIGHFSVTLSPDKAFGSKDPKLLRIVPTQQLLKQNIRPVVGLRLNIDDQHGTVRTVSPGRTIVDFNHPLASHEVTYNVEVISIVKETKEQVESLLHAAFIPFVNVTITGNAANIVIPAMFPKPLLDALDGRIRQLTSITTVSFEAGTPPSGNAKPHVPAHAAHDHEQHNNEPHNNATGEKVEK